MKNSNKLDFFSKVEKIVILYIIYINNIRILNYLLLHMAL